MFSFQLFTKLEGAVTAGMIHLGDQLGLYAQLKDAGEPITTAELADRAGLAERWVREWAYNQAAAKMVALTIEDDVERFTLTPEAAAVLATPEHPAYGMGMFHRLPQTMRALEEMPESFRIGRRPRLRQPRPAGCGRHRAQLRTVEQGQPAAERAAGARRRRRQARCRVRRSPTSVAAPGERCCSWPEAFPASHFAGYDISKYALGRAEQKLEESGVTNAGVPRPARRADPVEQLARSDHHLRLHPRHDASAGDDARRSVAAIRDDGTWLLVDIKAQDSFELNAKKNPMAALMYGISVLSCMSSALSEPDGAGLGTLGLSESKAREMAAAAGFTRFRKLDIDHSVNAFYEVRP